MNPSYRPSGRRSLARATRGLAGALLATLLGAGCDHAFEPFTENRNGPFSMVGYLDLMADTQWVRVMPIRQNLLAGPEPIDAVVTLEHPASGRTVTLRDSLFEFTDPRLGGVAYAHLFWTTERLQPKERYRVRAARSDGAASTVLVDMPAELEFTLLNLQRDTAWVEVKAEHVLFSETIHLLRSPAGDPGGSGGRRQRAATRSGQPGLYFLTVDGTPLSEPGLVDVGRPELRIVGVQPDWPYLSAPQNPKEALPDTMPSNVENGLGFVGGVASRTVPFHRCKELATRPEHKQPCAITYTRRSASIAGRVIRQPCGRPHALRGIRLTERFADGGAAQRSWKTGWKGEYHFEGIEAGAELFLEVDGGASMRLPTPVPGGHYAVPDMHVSVDC